MTREENRQSSTPEPQPETQTGRRGGVLILVAAIAVATGAGGALGALVTGPALGKRAAEKAASAALASHGGPVHEIENLIVNPAGSGGGRFLILTLAFEVDSPETAEQLKERDAQVRDALLGLLSTKTVEEFADVGRRDGLKEELREAVSDVLTVGEVRRIFLPQYVIQ